MLDRLSRALLGTTLAQEPGMSAEHFGVVCFSFAFRLAVLHPEWVQAMNSLWASADINDEAIRMTVQRFPIALEPVEVRE